MKTPREALLKYADKAQKDPIFTKAYQETQPEAIYAELSDDEDHGPEKKKARRWSSNLHMKPFLY
jgi:hypothetical protein